MTSFSDTHKEDRFLLEANGLYLKFGGVNVLTNVSTGVKANEIFAIIGPNGAGKTCLLNCINRFYHPSQGKIFFDGVDITSLKSHQIAALGIARNFPETWNYSGG